VTFNTSVDNSLTGDVKGVILIIFVMNCTESKNVCLTFMGSCMVMPNRQRKPTNTKTPKEKYIKQMQQSGTIKYADKNKLTPRYISIRINGKNR